jgi:hypothetical protein
MSEYAPDIITKKKKLNKKEKIKKPLIDELLKLNRKLNKEDLIVILSGIASGDVTDFTGLPPSLDTRIKAIDKLINLVEVLPDANLKEINVVIRDATDDEKIKMLEQKILDGNGKKE